MGREQGEYTGYSPVGVYIVEIVGMRENTDERTIRANIY